MSDKFSSKPSCDGKKLFIEVTGINHGSEQDFEFYDLTDMSQQSALESKKSIDPELDETTVYSWDWCAETENRNVWLKIEAEGSPIKLPLFQDVSSLARQSDEQDYLLHSVLPLTLLPTYQASLSNKDRLAPLRAGFIYIFYNHKAWREIHIQPEDSGIFSFKDVDLFSYRLAQDNPFRAEKRVATGAPLTELWIPAKDKGQLVKLHMAFSEVQWSAAYLNYLESHPDELVKRAVAFRQLNTVDSDQVLKVSQLPVMRTRSPELELSLAEPSKLNRDLSGEWVANTYQTIKEEFSSAQEDGRKAIDILQYIKPHQYEYGIKQSVLTEILTSDASQAESWTIGESEDFLQEAKQRYLRAVVLDDPLFDLRHHAFLTQFAVGYLQQVYVDMSQQEYYSCAELVQKLVVPAKFGQQENPFYEYRNEIDTYYGGRFHRTLRTIERMVCCRDVKELQGYVQSQINQPRLAQVLRDMSALDDINAAAAHVVVGYALSALSLNVDKLDQMSNSVEQSQAPHLETVKTILSSEGGHPLHGILFPEAGAISLEGDYTAPEPFNSGSGLATPESLALWSKERWLVNDEQLQIMDLAFMSPANSNGEGAFALEKRIANIIDIIFKGYFDALLALSQDLASEAKVIQFNHVYAPVLSLMKATNAEMWGDIVYAPVTGSEHKGIVVGVHGHGLSYGVSAADKASINNRRTGRLHDHSGKLVASTNKQTFTASDRISGQKGGVGAKLPLKVVVVSQESRMAAALNQANTQRTLQDLNRSELNASNAYEKLRVPYFIVVVELINLKMNQQHFLNMIQRKDTAYSVSSALSASLDLGVAITHASNLYTQNASRLAQASRTTAITMSDGLVTRFTFKNGSVKLVERISCLGFASISAGFLSAGIAGWQAIRAWQESDMDAGIAMGMTATGTLMTTVATGFFTTSAPILFGMGPVAWFGIGLAVAGVSLYMLWKDTPMEVWLKNGPFGESPAKRYAHLQDPDTAFERFLGLIFTLSVNAYRLGTQTDFPASFVQKMQQLGATHVIHVNTNLASLLDINRLDIHFYARQAIEKKTTTSSRIGSRENSEIIDLSQHNLAIIYQEQTEEGCAYFIQYDLEVPEYHTDSSWIKMSTYQYRYQPVLVLRTKLQMGQATFPCLALDESDDERTVTLVPSFATERKSDSDWAKDTVQA